MTDFKNSLEIICKSIQGDQAENEGGGKRGDQSHSNASAVLFLHVCEIKQLHDIYGKVNSILEIIQHKQWVGFANVYRKFSHPFICLDWHLKAWIWLRGKVVWALIWIICWLRFPMRLKSWKNYREIWTISLGGRNLNFALNLLRVTLWALKQIIL